METVYVFSDASVRGDWQINGAGLEVRAPEGLAMGAWVGWVGPDTEQRPVVTGTALLGAHEGPNRAEYNALIRGFSETWSFVEGCELESRPGAVILHTDNEQVAYTLTGRYGVDKLKDLRAAVREIQGRFECLGIEVHYEVVAGDAAGMKRAHEMSQRAFDQLLVPAWRPAGRGTALKHAASRKVPMWSNVGHAQATQRSPS